VKINGEKHCLWHTSDCQSYLTEVLTAAFDETDIETYVISID